MTEENCRLSRFCWKGFSGYNLRKLGKASCFCIPQAVAKGSDAQITPFHLAKLQPKKLRRKKRALAAVGRLGVPVCLLSGLSYVAVVIQISHFGHWHSHSGFWQHS